MNDDYIFNAVGKISDELISEADEDKVKAYYTLKRKNRKSKFLKFGTMAAGIVIIIGILIPFIGRKFAVPGNEGNCEPSAPEEKEDTIKIGNLSLSVASLSFDDINNRDVAHISVSSSEASEIHVSKLYIADDAYRIIGIRMPGKELGAVTVNNVTCYKIDVSESVLSFDIIFEGHTFTDNNGALKNQLKFKLYANRVSEDTLSVITLSPQ